MIDGQPSHGANGLWFAALGPLECSWDGSPLVLGGAKQQMVLSLLLLEANTVVSVDRLLEWVWHDDDARNAATLQVYVSNLRRLLAPAADALNRQLIVTRRPGYELRVEENEADVLAFDALRRQGETAVLNGRHASAAIAFRAALGMWRGEPLTGLMLDAEDTSVLRRLQLTRVTVLEQTAEAELATGHHREILGELQSWVDEHPLDERLRGHLMVALYRCGRQADALAVYRQGRTLLVEELGIEPSRELRELEGRILNQDRSLDFAAMRIEQLAQSPSTEVRSSVIAPDAVLDLGHGAVAIDRPILTIGRLPDRDVVLDDASVSRVHAEVRRLGRTFRLVDLGSANGTVVNGDRVNDHLLIDGDVIRFGSVEMTFRVVAG